MSPKDSPMSLDIRNAEARRRWHCVDFVRQLAAFEKLSHEVDATLR